MHLCRSTYYQYQHQTKPEQFKRRQVLYQQIRRIYFDHRRVYGAPKVHEELLREGYHASLKLVQKLMRHLGLRSIVVKKWRYEHNNYMDQMTYPNLLKQDFKAVKPNQKWAADITYIPTKTDGWCYLATIMDLYSRKIIAHKLSRHMTTELVVNVLNRLNGRDSTSMTKAILELANQLGDNLKTLTVDHGKEFANYNLIEEQTGVPLYFAHAYSPHERGSNENRNRVLRRFIPKGQPIDEITDDELIQINWYLNSRPLKCLNWRTPIEIFLRDLRY